MLRNYDRENEREKIRTAFECVDKSTEVDYHYLQDKGGNGGYGNFVFEFNGIEVPVYSFKIPLNSKDNGALFSNGNLIEKIREEFEDYVGFIERNGREIEITGKQMEALAIKATTALSKGENIELTHEEEKLCGQIGKRRNDMER